MTPPDMAVCAQAPLLNAAQLAWYRTLTRELPEHVVFAKVSLAAFVQLPEQVTGFAREAQQRRLTDAVIDFLVCDAAMRAVAAVQCSAHTGNAAQSAAFAAACVTASGVRWVEILPDTRETPETIRSLVLGA